MIVASFWSVLVRYDDFYSNVSRGPRQKEKKGALITSTSPEKRFEPSQLTVWWLV